MDPRIQAILAQYEHQEETEEEKSKPKTPESPKTFEEWLRRRPKGRPDWPETIDADSKFDISVESVGLGSLNEIMADLGRHARILIKACYA